MIRRLHPFALAFALAACAPATPVENPATVLDNMIGPAADLPWAEVVAALRFAEDSEARAVKVPAALKGARLGYFSDAPMLAQYSAEQRETMRRDDAGFAATLDLDGDGAPEIYRTGFWIRRDGASGTFLVVFEQGVQKGFIPTSRRNLFLSWHGGLRVADCNCAGSGTVSFDNDTLAIDWPDDDANQVNSL